MRKNENEKEKERRCFEQKIIEGKNNRENESGNEKFIKWRKKRSEKERKQTNIKTEKMKNVKRERLKKSGER